MLALKQTVGNEDPKTVIYPGDINSPMQFGSLQNLIYHRNISNKIKFEYMWDLAKPFNITDAKSQEKYRNDAIRFSASVGSKDQKTSEVERFRYDLLNGNKTSLSITMEKSEAKASYMVKAEGYKLVKNRVRQWEIGAPIRFYGFPETVVVYHQNADFFTVDHY